MKQTGYNGKRARQHWDHDKEERRDQKKRPVFHAQDSSSNDDLVVYRILCPDSVIGSVIGKNGNVINSIRQHTNAKVKVVDPFPGAEKRVILVYCYVKHRDLDADEDDDSRPVCAAQDALLSLQNAIVDGLDMLPNKHRDSDKKNIEEANILVPASQAASIIGKSGVVIKRLRATSKAFIKVSPKDPDEATHSCAMGFDNFVIGCLIGKGGSIVNDMRKKTKADIRISKGNKPRRASSSDELVEVFGEEDKLRDALVQIVLRLRETILKDSVDSQNSDMDRKLAAATTDSLYPSSLSLLPYRQVSPLGCDQRGETERGLEILPHSSSYGYSSLRAVDDDYGGLRSYTSKAYGGRLPHLEMAIPVSALSKVMGKRGTNLDNIRKISGAQIEIIESKSSRHDHIAQISGTPEQRQSAENLIKAFIMST
ncbi:hypothetical protein ACP4OV_017042 [Aristida adscensionis]